MRRLSPFLAAVLPGASPAPRVARRGPRPVLPGLMMATALGLVLALNPTLNSAQAAQEPADQTPVVPQPAAEKGLNGAPLSGPGSATDKRALISADELIHDKNLQTVTARGGVEIQYAGRILLADTVNYQISKDYASASGHVSILEPDGTVLFAEHMELNDQLKDGFVEQIRILLADGSRAAANKAVRSGGNSTEMDHAVYTGCDSCAEDPSAPPLWQIKALRVIHDQQEKTITYRNAWLEVGGIPVLYTPYMQHPDPSVKRQSGFLAPSYGGTSGLGVTITTPYYYAISPHQDLTFAPMFTSDEGVMLGGQYRIKGHSGELTAEGSITQDNQENIRNHFKLYTEMALDDTWRAGADINLTSDDTYMRRYGFSSPSFLTSRPYVEGFSRRSYAVVEGYYFQDLRDSSSTTAEAPVVAPQAQWSYSSAPSKLGSWHSAELSMATLTRDSLQGADSRRLSAGYGWHLPYIGPVGDVYQLDLNVHGDLYNVEDVILDDGSTFNGTTGRILPEAAFTWSMPFDRQHQTFQEVFEPIVQAVVSPRGQNSDKIPNEDSIDFEFDDTNLFSTNRFTGYDRVEGGARVNYGFRYGAYNGRNGRIGLTFGQTWHATSDGIFNSQSGLSEPFSDYVGRAQIRPTDNLDLLYRFRLDKDSLRARRNELGVRIGPPLLRLSTTYTMLDGTSLVSGEELNEEELAVALNSQLTRYWSIGLDTRHDLSDNGGTLRSGMSLRYDDECLTLDLSAARDYTYDRDYEDGYRFGLRVVFKTLGEVQTSASQ